MHTRLLLLHIFPADQQAGAQLVAPPNLAQLAKNLAGGQAGGQGGRGSRRAGGVSWLARGARHGGVGNSPQFVKNLAGGEQSPCPNSADRPTTRPAPAAPALASPQPASTPARPTHMYKRRKQWHQ